MDMSNASCLSAMEQCSDKDVHHVILKTLNGGSQNSQVTIQVGIR